MAFCARNADEVAQSTKDFTALGVRAFGTVLDIGDAPALAAWVDKAAADLGGLDIVVANVSALAIGNDEASWQKTFNVDMMGTVRLVMPPCPGWKKARLPRL